MLSRRLSYSLEWSAECEDMPEFRLALEHCAFSIATSLLACATAAGSKHLSGSLWD